MSVRMKTVDECVNDLNMAMRGTISEYADACEVLVDRFPNEARMQMSMGDLLWATRVISLRNKLMRLEQHCRRLLDNSNGYSLWIKELHELID